MAQTTLTRELNTHTRRVERGVLTPNRQERTGEVAPGASVDEWLAHNTPRKVHEGGEGIVHVALAGDGTRVVVATWESGEFDPRKFVRHSDWDALLTLDERARIHEPVHRTGTYWW